MHIHVHTLCCTGTIVPSYHHYSLGMLSVLTKLIYLAHAYQFLYPDPANQQTLDMIEKASFIVCLDQPHPHTSQLLNSSSADDHHRTVLANNVLHGNGTHYNSANRWFDHAFQVITCVSVLTLSPLNSCICIKILHDPLEFRTDWDGKRREWDCGETSLYVYLGWLFGSNSQLSWIIIMLWSVVVVY